MRTDFQFDLPPYTRKKCHPTYSWSFWHLWSFGASANLLHMQHLGRLPGHNFMTRVAVQFLLMPGRKPRQLLRHSIQQFLNSIFPTVVFGRKFLQGSFHIHELPIRGVDIIFHYYANLNENMVLENNTWNIAGVFFSASSVFRSKPEN